MDSILAAVILQIFALSTAALQPLSPAVQSSTPPVRILKQINRQNEDGSYSYGYENEDGSYKIETKSADGQVSGRYGYINAAGKQIEIAYGASNRGFEPAGPGITVPPPTLHVQSNNIESDYDDGQYREDPSIYDRTDVPPSGPKVTLHKPVAAAATAHPAPSFRYESLYPAQPPQQHQSLANNYRWYSGADNIIPPNIGTLQYEGHPGNYNPYAAGSYTIDFQG